MTRILTAPLLSRIVLLFALGVGSCDRPPAAPVTPPRPPRPPEYRVECRRQCSGAFSFWREREVVGGVSLPGAAPCEQVRNDIDRQPMGVTITTREADPDAQLAECIAHFDEPTSARVAGRQLHPSSSYSDSPTRTAAVGGGRWYAGCSLDNDPSVLSWAPHRPRLHWQRPSSAPWLAWPAVHRSWPLDRLDETACKVSFHRVRTRSRAWARSGEEHVLSVGGDPPSCRLLRSTPLYSRGALSSISPKLIAPSTSVPTRLKLDGVPSQSRSPSARTVTVSPFTSTAYE